MDEALDAGRTHEAREAPGNLHDREARLLLPLRGPEEHGEVEAQAGQHGEGPRGVDGERGERGQHLVAEVAREGGAGGRLEVAGAHQLEAALRERREDLAGEGGVELVHHRVRALGDPLQLLGGRHPGHVGRGVALGEGLLERRHPDHEELVEVAGHDAGELQPLEERVRGVAGLLEDAAVELEPGELAVQEELGLALLGLLHAGSPRGSPPCGRRPRSGGPRGRARRGARG